MSEFLPKFTEEQLLEIAEKDVGYMDNFHDREDAVQEWILGALIAGKKGDEDKAIRSYQWTSARRRALDYKIKQVWQQRKREKAILDLQKEEEQTLKDLQESKEVSPLEEVSLGDERARVKELVSWAMSFLNEREQKILALRHFENLTFKQIAAQVGVSKERVRQIDCKATNQMRERLVDHYKEELETMGFDTEDPFKKIFDTHFEFRWPPSLMQMAPKPAEPAPPLEPHQEPEIFTDPKFPDAIFEIYQP